jgi:hypothetical protein
VGRRIWVEVPAHTRDASFGSYKMGEICFDVRVLSFNQFLEADPSVGREKHLVQLWTDPGGMRTLSVGSIKLKDPKRVAAAKARHERERAAAAE